MEARIKARNALEKGGSMLPAKDLKEQINALGADLVGVASADYKFTIGGGSTLTQRSKAV
jgi:hypothetical protein